MALLLSTNPRPIREEIVTLAATLADTQERLQQIAARLEEAESGDWESRYEELRVSHTEAVNSAKWLRTQNLDLEHRLAQHKPEMDNALSAREAAFRKLKHARKVIRDLLAERMDMSSPRSNGSLTQEEINQALFDDFQRDDDSASSSDSEETVRMGANSTVQSPRTAASSPRSSPAPSSRHQVSPIMSPTMQTITSVAGSFRTPSSKHTSPLSEVFYSAQSSTQTLSQYRSPTGSSRGASESGKIHYKRPPGSSIVHVGPFAWPKLQSSLRLDDDMMNSLSSLASSSDLSMGLQITQLQTRAITAFLYDPVFLELEGRSYLLDWGRRSSNENVAKYISRHSTLNRTFHTFTFPTTQDTWFYIGALQWVVAPVSDLWPLQGKSKQKLLKKLSDRTRGEVSEVEMAKLLDSGELVQFCIELSGTAEDLKVSQDFAAQMLGRRAPAYTAEPRRERRPEGVME